MVCRTRLETRFIDAMLHIIRHGLVRSVEDGWLVHVVPEPGDTVVNKLRVERAPPFAGALAREIRKDRRPWPDFADVHGAVRLLHKVIARHSAVIRSVVRVRKMRDVQIRDGYDSEILFSQVFNHLCEVWELNLIDGERP